MSMPSFPSLETLSLKKARLERKPLGPPEVYPQMPNQDEDKLDQVNVREGFKDILQNRFKGTKLEEYSSIAKNFNCSSEDVLGAFKKIVQRKVDVNVMPDTSKRRGAISKDISLPMAGRTASKVEEWFKDFKSGEQLTKLSAKVPLSVKKEDILKEVFKNRLPVHRAIWYLKVWWQFSSSLSESSKKKKPFDAPEVQVKNDICTHLKDTFEAAVDGADEDVQDEWNYVWDLLVAMLDQSLFEQLEILRWVTEFVERCRRSENQLAFLLPHLLAVVQHFSTSELESRRFLGVCCSVVHDLSSVVDLQFAQRSQCPQHYQILLSVTSLIVTTILRCPESAVWSAAVSCESPLYGSPLDRLPCNLLCLPVPPKLLDPLRQLMLEIINRSAEAEQHWTRRVDSPDTLRLIEVLEHLDKHDYMSEDNKEALQQGESEMPLQDKDIMHNLFTKCFDREDPESDLRVANLLCQWAVHPSRGGCHRPVVAAVLMEKLRLLNRVDPVRLHDQLVSFLNSDSAPRQDRESGPDCQEPFRNLVALFGELIDREIFDHDSYARYLIAHDILSSEKAPLVFSETEYSPPGLAQQPSKHIQYLAHFPLPADDTYAHEASQRLHMLYGVGKSEEALKRFLRRLVREVSRLFTKKHNLMDASTGMYAKQRRAGSADEDAELNDIRRRFSMLTFCEMELVTAQGKRSLMESLRQFYEDPSCNILPSPSRMLFLMNLVELSGNLTGLIYFLVEISNSILKVENKICPGSAAAAGAAMPVTPEEQQRNNFLRMWSNKVVLRVLGYLRQYQAILMTMPAEMRALFSNLVRTNVKKVGNPEQCSCADRCTLAYLFDLYSQSISVKAGFHNIFSRARPKLKQAIYKKIEAYEIPQAKFPPTLMNLTHPSIEELLLNDEEERKRANSSEEEKRTNFFSYYLYNVLMCDTDEKVLKTCVEACECTTFCAQLPPRWLWILRALLNSASGSAKFEPVLPQMLRDLVCNCPNLAEKLSVLCGLLLSRTCFTIADFVTNVLFPVVSDYLKNQSAEPSARLAIHVFYLIVTLKLPLKSLTDKLLLRGAVVDKISSNSLSFFLKVLLLIPGDSWLECVQREAARESPVDLRSLRFADFAARVYKEITDSAWIREKFLRQPFTETLLSKEALLDSFITDSQARFILHSIAYRCPTPQRAEMTGSSVASFSDFWRQTQNFSHLFKGLSLWYLTWSLLEVELSLLRLISGPGDLDSTQRQFANSLCEFFSHRVAPVLKSETAATPTPSGGSQAYQLQHHQQLHQPPPPPGLPLIEPVETDWLVSLLIRKLSSHSLGPSIRAQIVKFAGSLLDCGASFSNAKADHEREDMLRRSSVLLAYPPFLCLLQESLAEESVRLDILSPGTQSGLFQQINRYIEHAEKALDSGIEEDLRVRCLLGQALRLRLSLVGSLFGVLLQNTSLCAEWSMLLAKLVTHSVVDIGSSREDFHRVIDMLVSLLHAVATGPPGSDPERQPTLDDERKNLLGVVKKLRKELKDSDLLPAPLRPLFVTPRLTFEVPVCRIARRPASCILHGREHMSPLELIEGVKTFQPLSLSWYTAMRYDLPPSRHELAHLVAPLTRAGPGARPVRDERYYLRSPDLPEEDLVPDEPKKMKMSNGLPAVPHQQMQHPQHPMHSQHQHPGQIPYHMMTPQQQHHHHHHHMHQQQLQHQHAHQHAQMQHQHTHQPPHPPHQQQHQPHQPLHQQLHQNPHQNLHSQHSHQPPPLPPPAPQTTGRKS
uniref:Med12 domain-containing protein n=1 Tax=Macrostomum lignano TaxID=282301 RepID=A0A1I8G1J3_9PLAT